jgi:hypothetical protein
MIALSFQGIEVVCSRVKVLSSFVTAVHSMCQE